MKINGILLPIDKRNMNPRILLTNRWETLQGLRPDNFGHLNLVFNEYFYEKISVCASSAIDDCAKDGGKEFFTKMHCVLLSNSYRIVKDSNSERSASW